MNIEDDRLRVTTLELKDAWNPRGEWGALGPMPIADDEVWEVVRAHEDRDEEDIRALGPVGVRFVDRWPLDA